MDFAWVFMGLYMLDIFTKYPKICMEWGKQGEEGVLWVSSFGLSHRGWMFRNPYLNIACSRLVYFLHDCGNLACGSSYRVGKTARHKNFSYPSVKTLVACLMFHDCCFFSWIGPKKVKTCSRKQVNNLLPLQINTACSLLWLHSIDTFETFQSWI